jgi:hypothetical protein
MEISMTDQITGQSAPGQPPSSAGSTTASASLGQNDASHDRETSHATAADIKQAVSDDIHAASDFAKREIATATDKAKEAADERKNFLADKIGGVAQAMEKVAKELEQGDNPEIGRMTQTLGANMRKFSNDIQDRSLGEIASMAEDFGRKQPLAFLGVAAIAGLAASRFLTASALSAGTSGKTGTSSRTSPSPAPIGLTPTLPRATSTGEGSFNG